MVNTFDIKGKITNDLYEKIKSDLSLLPDVKEIHVNIDSNGGEVEAGMNIYNFLKDLRKNGVKVITYAGSNIGSIAESIFLAGEERVIYSSTSAWVHEPTMGEFTADYFQATANQLYDTKKQLFSIHRAVADPSVTDEEIMKSLSEETFIKAEDYLAKGYATKMIDNTTFAEKQTINKINNNKMEDKTSIDLVMEKIDKITGFLFNKKPMMNMIVQSISGDQLEFPDLTDGQLPKVGDSVLINGQPANGEFEMEDGAIYECIDGKLFEIYPPDMQVKALKKKNAELEASVKRLNSENESLSTIINNSAKEVSELKEKVSVIMNERRKPETSKDQEVKFNFKKRNI